MLGELQRSRIVYHMLQVTVTGVTIRSRRNWRANRKPGSTALNGGPGQTFPLIQAGARLADHGGLLIG